ncbi:lytTr DNA-binding domain protein [Clostridium sp. CAG:226]|nr:lytTr DNA-binding domain protein [Clostridium sp. CAG:226]
MLNIAICDDDALHGRHTAAQISGLDGFAAAKLSLFTSADNLIYAITEDNYAVDIAVLDIQMESMDGIELAKRINEIAPECQIIFLSGHIEYASKVYDAEHVFFVLKSQSETYLKSALEKAVHRRESAKANYIVITNGANAQRMPWDKVQYLERVLRRTKVVTADGYCSAKSL